MEKSNELEYMKKKLKEIDTKFDEIRDVVDSNKEDFEEELPTETHEEKFMAKLQTRIRNYIDLTPYLVKVAIVTVIIFIASIFVWYSFFRIDKNKPVIENIIDQFKKK